MTFVRFGIKVTMRSSSFFDKSQYCVTMQGFYSAGSYPARGVYLQGPTLQAILDSYAEPTFAILPKFIRILTHIYPADTGFSDQPQDEVGTPQCQRVLGNGPAKRSPR
jgi:hypothetical protein